MCVVAAGLRLDADQDAPYQQLNELARKGAVVLSGDRTSGGIWADSADEYCRKLLAVKTLNYDDRPLEARVFILAGGKFFSMGLRSDSERVFEPVFGSDVEFIPGRENWYSPDFFAPQPFMGFGVKTDTHGRVLFGGKPALNLYAVGSIVAANFTPADPSKIELPDTESDA